MSTVYRVRCSVCHLVIDRLVPAVEGARACQKPGGCPGHLETVALLHPYDH